MGRLTNHPDCFQKLNFLASLHPAQPPPLQKNEIAKQGLFYLVYLVEFNSQGLNLTQKGCTEMLLLCFHNCSLGMSPVSLLDVAANHVSATVMEIGRTVCIWKASQAKQDDFNGSFASSPAPLNLATVNSPSLCSVEVKLLHQTKVSSGAVMIPRKYISKL